MLWWHSTMIQWVCIYIVKTCGYFITWHLLAPLGPCTREFVHVTLQGWIQKHNVLQQANHVGLWAAREEYDDHYHYHYPYCHHYHYHYYLKSMVSWVQKRAIWIWGNIWLWLCSGIPEDVNWFVINGACSPLFCTSSNKLKPKSRCAEMPEDRFSHSSLGLAASRHYWKSPELPQE